MDKLHEMQKLIRRIDFRIEILKKKRKSITEAVFDNHSKCDMMYEIIGAFVKSQYYKNVPTGTPDDIMSKMPKLDKDTIETIKNCDLT